MVQPPCRYIVDTPCRGGWRRGGPSRACSLLRGQHGQPLPSHRRDDGDLDAGQRRRRAERGDGQRAASGAAADDQRAAGGMSTLSQQPNGVSTRYRHGIDKVSTTYRPSVESPPLAGHTDRAKASTERVIPSDPHLHNPDEPRIRHRTPTYV